MKKVFINDNFVLETKTAQKLYHEHAEGLPIIDYHCHLDPKLILEDYRFKNIGEIWLKGDHYKWRAMRANGVNEKYCTGKDTSDWEKFEKWAETVPYTMGNPLYHWTHLELKTAFGISKLLNKDTAKEIYDECNEKLKSKEFSARGLLKHYKVETLCTTDDPVDSLSSHIALKKEGFSVRVLPAWRPDKTMRVENPQNFREYVENLSQVSGISVSNYKDFLSALKNRHDFFNSVGCRLSDHGLEAIFAEDYTEKEIEDIFNKVYGGGNLNEEEIAKFKSAVLFEGAKMDDESGWTQQFHYGAIRDNSGRMYETLGPDTGFDSIGDFTVAQSMAKFFNRLDKEKKLAKTIVYNLNPRDNYLVASMMGNYQDGSVPGKMQFGAAWWFLDQKTGIEDQLQVLSNIGLLSRFVGMLTDSRSFLSYPRHEYFRRILCNFLANKIEKGLLPESEEKFIGKIVENISYYNAKKFFNF